MTVRIRPRRLSTLLAALILTPLAAGCTSILDRPTAGTANLPGGAPVTITSVSITPVTPDGMVTGPGVTDGAIRLGVLAQPARNRGFTDGVRLWQQSVNTSGGLCGRTIELSTNGVDGVPEDLPAAYQAVGTSTLGLLTPGSDGSAALSASIAADQIPAIAATGTSAQLGPSGPVVAGATADILAINGLSHLLRAGALAAGDTVGVPSDGSGIAENALRGARWFAAENGLTLDVRDAGTDPAEWADDRLLLALTDASTVSSLLAALPAQTSVLTLLDGFDPAGWGPATTAAADGRLYVATPTPAYGSDYPAAVGVTSWAAAAGTTAPGARLLDGFATGATWGRLITEACGERMLTRPGIDRAVTTVGPAPATSLFGPSDPGLVVLSGLPATRVSSISVVDTSSPAGLRSLAGLESAPGIEDYTP
jgi:hypothetical protein